MCKAKKLKCTLSLFVWKVTGHLQRLVRIRALVRASDAEPLELGQSVWYIYTVWLSVLTGCLLKPTTRWFAMMGQTKNNNNNNRRPPSEYLSQNNQNNARPWKFFCAFSKPNLYPFSVEVSGGGGFSRRCLNIKRS